MPGDKLLSLLRGFDKYELNRFRKYLSSPYFNEQEDLLRLFDLIHAALRKSGETDGLSKEKIWGKLYAKQAYDDAHLRRMSSDLNLLGQQFLADEARNLQAPEYLPDIQRALDRPEWSKHLNAVERQFLKHYEQSEQRSANDYLHHFRFYRNIYNRAGQTVAATDYVDKIIPADEYLDYFYAVQKLKFYVGWLIFRGFRATPWEMPIIPGFWTYLNQERFQKLPLIALYQSIIQCLQEPDEEGHFQQFLDQLSQNKHRLDEEDQRDCYQIAQNYCAFKINQGRTEYYSIYFNLLKDIIDLGILLKKDLLQEAVYKNIISVSLVVGEFAWAEQFISEYALYLPVNIRENAKAFNLANLYFFQKKYDRAIELLRTVEFSDVVYSLNAKVMLVRTYYETDEFMALDSLIDSFRIFLRRNKLISKASKVEINNFLRFVKRLSALPPGKNAQLANLRVIIEKTASVIHRRWLLDKIDNW